MTTIPADANADQYGPEFLDALDEVHTRFLLNLPPEELSTSDRIFFQLEQAWWFYEDMICDLRDTDGILPRFSQLKPFAKHLFYFSPLLRHMKFDKMWKEFTDYKRKISTYGCILLNTSATHVLLCQMYKSDTWTVPAGKINQGESGVAAAARETYEETGFDPHCEMGVTKDWLEQDPSRVTWTHPLNEERNMVTFVEPNGKRRTCYICHGVPDDGSFAYAPVCRKEVGMIRWFDLTELPKKSFAVLPFMAKVRKWIKRNLRSKSRNKRDKSSGRDRSSGRDKSKGRSGSNRRNAKNKSTKSPDRSASTARLIDSGLLASEEDAIGWSASDMFKANEALSGRKVDYDGNPHVFAEQGFQGNDPHAFRVVGGTFMNSDTQDASLATPANPQEKYQPLVNTIRDKGDMDVLQPFFTSDGTTPWGELVEEAKPGSILPTMVEPGEDEAAAVPSSNNQINQELWSTRHLDGNDGLNMTSGRPRIQVHDAKDENGEDVLDVLTDKQITAKRQAEYQREQRMLEQYEEDMKFVRDWVQKLPNPTGFKIQNLDAIMAQHFGPGY
jgi:mRNA-decapping enzyme subunit 2